MVAFILTCCLGFLVWLVRSWLSEANKREERMSKRIDKLEDFQREELQKSLERNSLALENFKAALDSRPCFASSRNVPG